MGSRLKWAQGSGPPPVLVTSTSPDRFNTNASIRNFLGYGLGEVLGAGNVAIRPLELAERALSVLRPQLTVAVGSLACDIADLRRLRHAAEAAGSAIALWLHDDPYEFDYGFKTRDLADILFCNDLWSLAHHTHPNAHHLSMAGLPAVHLRPITPVATRDLAMFFCGVAYKNRIDLIRQADAMLCRHPVAVHGAGWPSDIRCARNVRLSPEEMANYAARARLTLNVGRDLDIANSRYSLPPSTPGPRTFEIALSGSAQLYFASGLEILEYFEGGTEIILIDHTRDIEIAIERAYDAPEEIEAIARRAQERAQRDHTYEHRARRILSVAAETLGLAALIRAT